MITAASGLGWPGHLAEPAAGLGWPAADVGDKAAARPSTASVPERFADALPDATPLAEDEARLASAPATDESGVSRETGTRGRLPRPSRTRILTVANQKGGVGKTTTTVNMAAALALQGLSVLVLDLDPQGNASTALGVDHRAGTPDVYAVLIEGRPLSDVVTVSGDVPGLSCAPATIDLAGAEIELVPLVARELRLHRALQAYLEERSAAGEPQVDYVLIDCPPSLGLLTVNALAAATEVLIPIQCEYYALEGLSQLLRNVDLIRAHLNPALEVGAVLLTMYDGRTKLASQVADDVRSHFGDRVLSTAVPRSVRVSEAPSYGQTVLTYDPGSPGALAYTEAARELARQTATAHATAASS